MRIYIITKQNLLLMGILGLGHGYFIADFTSYPAILYQVSTALLLLSALAMQYRNHLQKCSK